MPRFRDAAFPNVVLATGFSLPSTSQMIAMGFLAEHGGTSKIADIQFDWSQATGKIQSGVQDALDRTVKDGFATRTMRARADGEKGKGSFVYTLTPKGYAILTALRGLVVETTKRTLTDMPEKKEPEAAKPAPAAETPAQAGAAA
jgi:DNA-binding PadR family transcriptional regulator